MLIPKEFMPHPILKPYVKCHWTLEGCVDSCGSDSMPTTWRKQFLSDAGLKISFNLADPVDFILQSNQVIRASKGSVCGVITRNYWVCLTGSVMRFGVQFHPGGAYPFFPFSPKKLTDRFVDIESIWGKTGLSLTEAIQCADITPQERIGLIEAFLFHRLEQYEKDDPIFDKAVLVTRTKQGQVVLEKLASQIGLSLKQLERKFVENSGISPKLLCRIIRFRHLFEHITSHPTDKWVDTALACGYYDQAHLIRDFNRFTGLSPGAFIKKIVNQDLFINWGYDMEALAGFGNSIRSTQPSIVQG